MKTDFVRRRGPRLSASSQRPPRADSANSPLMASEKKWAQCEKDHGSHFEIALWDMLSEVGNSVRRDRHLAGPQISSGLGCATVEITKVMTHEPLNNAARTVEIF